MESRITLISAHFNELCATLFKCCCYINICGDWGDGGNVHKWCLCHFCYTVFQRVLNISALSFILRHNPHVTTHVNRLKITIFVAGNNETRKINACSLAKGHDNSYFSSCLFILKYILKYICHLSFLHHKLMYNGSFQTLNCSYSFGVQPMLPKFCVALVTRYDLLS